MPNLERIPECLTNVINVSLCFETHEATLTSSQYESHARRWRRSVTKCDSINLLKVALILQSFQRGVSLASSFNVLC